MVERLATYTFRTDSEVSKSLPSSDPQAIDFLYILKKSPMKLDILRAYQCNPTMLMSVITDTIEDDELISMN